MGFSMKEFYCCGKLKSISLTIVDEGKAKCKHGDSNTDGCCKNKFQYLKVKDNHVKAVKTILQSSFLSVLDTQFPALQSVPFSSIKENTSYQSNAPPLYNGVPVYLSNCVFRI
jgi:hypothetical protein